jgi:ubiquinone/menaquinone biosynthesis C-methylase UbiE
MKRGLDYDRIAAGYDRRFEHDAPSVATARALVDVIRPMSSPHILEVGCGTGHWLGQLAPVTGQLYGLDRSWGMLAQASAKDLPAGLVQGDAVSLPFARAAFDLLYCVNAIHHFSDQRRFIMDAARVIAPHGRIAILGSDPFYDKNSWYVYDYFEGVWEIDRARFKSWDLLAAWLSAAGFERVEKSEIRHIHTSHEGREVFSDPFLRKQATSQLALLSQEAYDRGLERIQSAIQKAQDRGEPIRFETELSIFMLTGVKQAA